MKKRIFGIPAVFLVCLLLLVMPAKAKTQKENTPGKWVVTSNHRMYRLKDGSFAADIWLTIDGREYLFNEKGYALFGMEQWNGNTYFIRRNTGAATGWVKYQGKRYYFKSNGVMVKDRWMTYKGRKYYLKSSGKMATGWLILEGKKYYLGTDGKMVTGWKRIRKNTYYFAKSGAMAVSKWLNVKGKTYYVDANGHMVTGWFTLEGKKYYFGTDGVMVTGEQWIAGKGYYFSKKGVYNPKKKVESRVDPNKPMVALTFDDGPGPYTDRLLDCLKENNGVATFFLVGSSISRYKSTVSRAFRLGCEIGSHSWDHPPLTGLSSYAIQSQMDQTNDLIRSITGQNATVMRPPYGACNSNVLANVKAPAIMWSIDTRDWEHRNADQTISIVMSQVQDGDIILMHDIHSTSVDAAERLIPLLKKKGFQLVTVSELAKYKKITLHTGQKYSFIR